VFFLFFSFQTFKSTLHSLLCKTKKSRNKSRQKSPIYFFSTALKLFQMHGTMLKTVYSKSLCRQSKLLNPPLSANSLLPYFFNPSSRKTSYLLRSAKKRQRCGSTVFRLRWIHVLFLHKSALCALSSLKEYRIVLYLSFYMAL